MWWAILIYTWALCGFVGITFPLVVDALYKGNIFQRIFIVFICGPASWVFVGAYCAITYTYEFLGKIKVKELK